MKVLVTGAAGFIGSAICRRLVDEGHEVVGVDSFTDYYSPAIKRANAAALVGVRVVENDLLTANLTELLTGVEVVYHQCGQPGVRASWGREFHDYVERNIMVTQRLLEAVKQSESLRRFVYASSSSVYGNASTYPVVESQLPAPRSPYGVTKLAAEHLVSLYSDNFGLPTASLRYFTVYGPGQRPDMAFTRFITQALSGRSLTVFGDGHQIRDFTYIDDVVEANILCAKNDVPPGAIYNVSGGSNVSLRDVFALLSDFVGPLDLAYGDKVLGDVARTGGDSTKLRSAVGWAPATSIDIGLAAQVEFIKSNLDVYQRAIIDA